MLFHHGLREAFSPFSAVDGHGGQHNAHVKTRSRRTQVVLRTESQHDAYRLWCLVMLVARALVALHVLRGVFVADLRGDLLRRVGQVSKDTGSRLAELYRFARGGGVVIVERCLKLVAPSTFP